MPNLCSHFHKLETRVASLIEKFVEDQVANELAEPGSHLPDTDRLAAFRLLTHAEIEEFLEAKAKEGLDKLKNDLSKPSMTFSSVLNIFPLACALDVKLSCTWPYESEKFQKEASTVTRKADESITKNNGVKGESFFLLSLISGKLPDEVDQTLGTSLTSYGKGRGDVAHKSAAGVRTLRAPSAEKKAVKDLVQQLATYFNVEST